MNNVLLGFNYSHLPQALQEVAMPFQVLAHRLWQLLPENVERDIALKKLLDAKDTAVVSKLLAIRDTLA